MLSVPHVIDPVQTGGSPIIGYELQIDDGKNGDFRYVIGGDLSNPTLQTRVFVTKETHGIEAGLSYRTRYRVINDNYVSDWSDETYVNAITLPKAPPSPVVTSFN